MTEQIENKIVVHKFPIRVADKVVIEMDPKARFLEFATQRTAEGEQMALWALVDPSAPKEERTFQLAGTGHPIKPFHRYVGTTQLHGGDIVFHLFEFLPDMAAEHAERVASADQRATGEDAGIPTGTPSSRASERRSSQPRPLFEGPSV